MLVWLLWACVSTSTPSVEPVATPVPVAQAPAPLPEGWLERVIGSDDPEATMPMVVMVHGLGDRPESMLRVLGELPGPVRIIAPRAPEAWHDGWSWFSMRAKDSDPAQISQQMADRADEVAAQLRVVLDARPTQGKPVISGFSQGGMLSFAVAVRHPDLLAGAVPVAGWLPEPMWPERAPTNAPPIRALHGLDDDVLPFPPTSAAVDALRAAGWDASLQAFPGVKHSIPAPVREALYRELLERR